MSVSQIAPITTENGTVLPPFGPRNTEGAYQEIVDEFLQRKVGGMCYNILSEIETSLNNFLSDTTFPYEYTARKIQIGNTAESGGGFGNWGGSQEAVIYETAQDYIDSLNTDVEWVTYVASWALKGII